MTPILLLLLETSALQPRSRLPAVRHAREPRSASTVRLCDREAAAPTEAAETATPPATAESNSLLGPREAALAGVPLFFLLESTTVGLARSGLPPDLAPPVGRAAAFGLFAAVQAASGTSVDTWLLRPAAEPEWRWLAAPWAPAAVFAAFAAAALAPALACQLFGQAEVAEALLPAGGPPPSAARCLDVLLLAPLTEEAFFRGWLLTASARAGAPRAASAAASAALFALWHAGDGAGGLLAFAALGGWLAVVYQAGGGRLAPCVGGHVLWNALILALRAAR